MGYEILDSTVEGIQNFFYYTSFNIGSLISMSLFYPIYYKTRNTVEGVVLRADISNYENSLVNLITDEGEKVTLIFDTAKSDNNVTQLFCGRDFRGQSLLLSELIKISDYRIAVKVHETSGEFRNVLDVVIPKSLINS